jgi:hypothetical protein
VIDRPSPGKTIVLAPVQFVPSDEYATEFVPLPTATHITPFHAMELHAPENIELCVAPPYALYMLPPRCVEPTGLDMSVELFPDVPIITDVPLFSIKTGVLVWFDMALHTQPALPREVAVTYCVEPPDVV